MTPAEYKTQSATQEVNSQGNVNMYVVLKVCIIYFVGIGQWYDRGLQNLWWEFDSLIPCSKPLKMKAFARLRLHG